jgi:hypothetical protein
MYMDTRAVHLILLVGGFFSNHWGLNNIQKELSLKQPSDSVIVISKSNLYSFTKNMDGIENFGKRLYEEITELLSKYNIDRISFVGVSLGGVASRVAIRYMYDEKTNKLLNGIIPMNFITLASPHLGVRKEATILSYPVELLSNSKYIIMDTLDDLYLKTDFLLNISNPESNYIKALSLFQKRKLYSNVINDNRVSYCSGAIFPNIPNYTNISKLKGYPHILLPNEIFKNSNILYYEKESIEYKIITNLNTLEWERVDCLFDGWFGYFLNHNHIGASSSLINFDDSVKHLADNF